MLRRDPQGALHVPKLLAAALLGGLVAACSGGGGGGSASQSGVVGEEVSKQPGNPNAPTFFVDPNRSGGSSRLVIEEMFWGRLVDVHDIDAFGDPSEQPVFRDFVINDIIQTDGANYVLDQNEITQRTRLVIQRRKDVVQPLGIKSFRQLLDEASANLPPIRPFTDGLEDTVSENQSTVPDPSLVARNSALVIRFNDLLDDDDEAASNLATNVQFYTGYPAATPFSPRLIFDPNHGALVGGKFHSTRIIADMTVSQSEAADGGPSAPPINAIGLPPSVANDDTPNVSMRIPTRTDAGSSQFTILRALRGAALNANGGPNNPTAGTRYVVRGMRSGRSLDENNGFLTDLNPPRVVGNWPLNVDACSPDPAGQANFDFILTVTFSTPCQARPDVGDIVSVGDEFLEVSVTGNTPDNDGRVVNLSVRALSEDGTTAAECLGTALFLSLYDPDVLVAPACWLSFTPSPRTFPASDVDPTAQVLVRFSEPMDPDSVAPFSTYSVVAGGVDANPTARNTVVGEIGASADLREFTFNPKLDLAHTQAAEQYHVELIGGAEGVTDLAGNALRDSLPFISFAIDPTKEPVSNGGVVFRFNAVDEVTPGTPDVRGQFFYDFGEGLIRPRPVTYASAAADRNNVLPGNMIAIPNPLQTPLVPLGSKMQTVWRYADLGWQIADETKYNLDVIGLNWSPFGGALVGDFYEQFEIRLSHAQWLPDEDLDTASNLQIYPNSGLRGPGAAYTSNILNDPITPQRVVHQRSFGYQINPSQRFVNSGGTTLMPWPLNTDPDRDAATYTWRDTAALSVGGPNGTGIPMGVEVRYGLEATAGSFAATGEVPTIGLPLLMEFRCYPSTEGIGLNGFDVSIATNASSQPFFRAFSQGGNDTQGVAQQKNPDIELSPSGGFNPTSNPPGQSTPGGDNVFYMGQLDYVIRVSRVHTIWVDTNTADPDFLDPVFEPNPDSYPVGTQLVTDYRGAEMFSGMAEPFDASMLDPYGIPLSDTVTFHSSGSGWSSDIDAIDGARYVQMRFSFLSNIESVLTADLSGVGIAFDFD